jgi:hypothetical protein
MRACGYFAVLIVTCTTVQDAGTCSNYSRAAACSIHSYASLIFLGTVISDHRGTREGIKGRVSAVRFRVDEAFKC